MKKYTIALVFATIFAWLALASSVAYATQEAGFAVIADDPPPIADTIAATEPTIASLLIAQLPESVQPVLNSVVGKVSPSTINLIASILFYYGVFSVGWQALWGWVDKQTKATASVADDNWVAKLKSNVVFRILDKIAYFGELVGGFIAKFKVVK